MTRLMCVAKFEQLYVNMMLIGTINADSIALLRNSWRLAARHGHIGGAVQEVHLGSQAA